MPTRETALVAHGLSLRAKDWEDMIFGKPPKLLGRASRAIQLYADKYPHASHLLFGSGATSKEYRGRELKESEYTIQYILDNFSKLFEFDGLERLSKLNRWRLKNRIRRIAKPMLEPKNTIGELRYAIPFCRDAGISEIVLVADPPFISRCIGHGEHILEELGLFGKIRLVGEQSDVCHPDQRAADVVIFEPPPGDPEPVGTILRGIFDIKEKLPEFKTAVKDLIAQHRA
ncbi:MAG TPA: hypothetical protein VNM40_02245 [Candidatus Paceibacterota bacterium]|nr:hypothetical protein [Candidatus Paceibacterota bacterium]